MRVTKEVRAALRSARSKAAVWAMLENVSSCTEAFHEEACAAYQGLPFFTQAFDWDWTDRKRKF